MIHSSDGCCFNWGSLRWTYLLLTLLHMLVLLRLSDWVRLVELVLVTSKASLLSFLIIIILLPFHKVMRETSLNVALGRDWGQRALCIWVRFLIWSISKLGLVQTEGFCLVTLLTLLSGLACREVVILARSNLGLWDFLVICLVCFIHSVHCVVGLLEEGALLWATHTSVVHWVCGWWYWGCGRIHRLAIHALVYLILWTLI